jgi:hypothetical protein
MRKIRMGMENERKEMVVRKNGKKIYAKAGGKVL